MTRRSRLLPLLVALGVVLTACAPDDAPPAAARPAPEASPTPSKALADRPTAPRHAPAPRQYFDVADAVVPSVPLFAAPEPASPPAVENLAHPAPFGVPLSFMVIDRQDDWLQVQVPTRPNQRTAWIRSADVSVRQVPNRVLVELGARRFTVFRGRTDEVLHQATVAIGSTDTPTPVGELFFIDAVVHLGNTGGVYGPYQLRTSAFSEVLTTSDGGPGQVAFHGTNAPQLIGQAVSNGCIRMRNDDIVRLAELAAVGTPVRIIP